MGATVTGMDAWLRDLQDLPERADKAFVPVMKRAGGNIKDDWSALWTAMPHRHIPHLVKVGAFSYDVTKNGLTYSVEVGVRTNRIQSRLASFIENGTLTSRPHPGGPPSLEAEAPRMAQWAAKVAADLLEQEVRR